jgi:hypothetical protein
MKNIFFLFFFLSSFHVKAKLYNVKTLNIGESKDKIIGEIASTLTSTEGVIDSLVFIDYIKGHRNGFYNSIMEYELELSLKKSLSPIFKVKINNVKIESSKLNPVSNPKLLELLTKNFALKNDIEFRSWLESQYRQTNYDLSRQPIRDFTLNLVIGYSQATEKRCYFFAAYSLIEKLLFTSIYNCK